MKTCWKNFIRHYQSLILQHTNFIKEYSKKKQKIFNKRISFGETLVFLQPRKSGLYTSRLHFSFLDIMNSKNSILTMNVSSTSWSQPLDLLLLNLLLDYEVKLLKYWKYYLRHLKNMENSNKVQIALCAVTTIYWKEIVQRYHIPWNDRGNKTKTFHRKIHYYNKDFKNSNFHYFPHI